METDEDYLPMSGIQHFAFCRRQWALIHIENQWVENVLTAEGRVEHKKAHDENSVEKRRDLIITRGMRVSSSRLKLSGACDVVEFHQSASGHPLVGEDGLWIENPVEYKHGHSKTIDADRLQLAAQAMCLEEMFATSIPYGFLYYGETRSRERVELGQDLREAVKNDFGEMHKYYQSGWVPKAKYKKYCKSCSLKDVCMPKKRSVEDYIDDALGDVS